jgi:hypothetical protein
MFYLRIYSSHVLFFSPALSIFPAIDLVTFKQSTKPLVDAPDATLALPSSDVLASRIEVINFGGPRVGNKEFAELVYSLHFFTRRFVNHADLVPQTPPMFMGYEHYPEEVWIRGTDYFVCHETDKNGEQWFADEPKLKHKSNKWNIFKSLIFENPHCSISLGFASLKLDDHFLYFDRVDTSKCR